METRALVDDDKMIGEENLEESYSYRGGDVDDDGGGGGGGGIDVNMEEEEDDALLDARLAELALLDDEELSSLASSDEEEVMMLLTDGGTGDVREEAKKRLAELSARVWAEDDAVEELGEAAEEAFEKYFQLMVEEDEDDEVVEDEDVVQNGQTKKDPFVHEDPEGIYRLHQLLQGVPRVGGGGEVVPPGVLPKFGKVTLDEDEDEELLEQAKQELRERLKVESQAKREQETPVEEVVVEVPVVEETPTTREQAGDEALKRETQELREEIAANRVRIEEQNVERLKKERESQRLQEELREQERRMQAEMSRKRQEEIREAMVKHEAIKRRFRERDALYAADQRARMAVRYASFKRAREARSALKDVDERSYEVRKQKRKRRRAKEMRGMQEADARGEQMKVQMTAQRKKRAGEARAAMAVVDARSLRIRDGERVARQRLERNALRAEDLRSRKASRLREWKRKRARAKRMQDERRAMASADAWSAALRRSKQVDAAETLQAVVRTASKQLWLLQRMFQRYQAAVIIQRIARGYVVRRFRPHRKMWQRRLEARARERKAAAHKIGALVRGFLVRRRKRNLERHVLAEMDGLLGDELPGVGDDFLAGLEFLEDVEEGADVGARLFAGVRTVSLPEEDELLKWRVEHEKQLEEKAVAEVEEEVEEEIEEVEEEIEEEESSEEEPESESEAEPEPVAPLKKKANKLRKLAEEWGFTDERTAKAMLKKKRHWTQAARMKRRPKLDPVQRLERQRQREHAPSIRSTRASRAASEWNLSAMTENKRKGSNSRRGMRRSQSSRKKSKVPAAWRRGKEQAEANGLPALEGEGGSRPVSAASSVLSSVSLGDDDERTRLPPIGRRPSRDRRGGTRRAW